MYVLLLIFYLLIFSFCSTVCAVLTLPWFVGDGGNCSSVRESVLLS